MVVDVFGTVGGCLLLPRWKYWRIGWRLHVLIGRCVILGHNRFRLAPAILLAYRKARLQRQIPLPVEYLKAGIVRILFVLTVHSSTLISLRCRAGFFELVGYLLLQFLHRFVIHNLMGAILSV